MFIKVDNLNIFYKKAGQGNKVMFLHGWMGRADSFLPVFNYLSSKFEVYAIDFPGFGQSTEPGRPWDVRDYMNLVLKVFDALGIDKAHIVAHSFGGRVAIMLAAEHPERVGKMVLADSAGLIPKRGVKYYFKVYSFKFYKKVYLTFTDPEKRQQKLDEFYKRYGSKDYRDSGNLRQTFTRVVNQDLRGYLHSIKASTLLIWGDQDKDTPIYMGRIMEKEIPDAGLVLFKGAGHFAYLERLGDFNIIVVKFFEGDE